MSDKKHYEKLKEYFKKKGKKKKKKDEDEEEIDIPENIAGKY
jgi:hypothetical protein